MTTTTKKAPAKTGADTAQKSAAKAPAPSASKQPAPANKAAPLKPKAAPATTAKAVAKPAAKPAAPTQATAKPAARPAPAQAPAPEEAMKASETKTAPPAKAAKPAKKSDPSALTEAALVAMSEKDYMNEAQLAFFKAKLEGMRDEILENARETGEHLKENEVFADPNDRATVEEENLLEQRVRDRERKLLKKINASLARIEEGNYGYCLETGDPIGIPRLLARPTAELSIEAQEKHERLEKLYAD